MSTSNWRWWSRRSKIAVAVAASGRKLVNCSKGHFEVTARLRALVGSGHQSEQVVGGDGADRREAELVDEDQVGAQDGVDDAAEFGG